VVGKQEAVFERGGVGANQEQEYQLPPKMEPPKKMMVKKWMIGVVVGVIVVIVVIVVVLGGRRESDVMMPTDFEPVKKLVLESGFTAGWLDYEDEGGYQFKYPQYWELTKGNSIDPVLSQEAVTVGSGEKQAVVVAVDEERGNDLDEEEYFSNIKPVGEILFAEVVAGEMKGRRAEIIQVQDRGNVYKLIYTKFVKEGRAYTLSTSFMIDPETKEPVDVEVEEQLKIYDQVVASFGVK
jgi:hypothetical protein